jgi:hypothetical protein
VVVVDAEEVSSVKAGILNELLLRDIHAAQQVRVARVEV